MTKAKATTKKEIKTLLQLFNKSKQDRHTHRLHAIFIHLQGASAADVAKLFHKSPRCIQNWTRTYRKKGAFSLLEKQKPGKPKTLSLNELKQIKNLIQSTQNPDQAEQLRWNGNTLRSYIQKKHHKELSLRQCQRILKQIKTEATL